MRKILFSVLIGSILLTGCGSDEYVSQEEKEEMIRKEAYDSGYWEGINALNTKYKEDIRPEYNWLLENYHFFENNFCVVSPDKTYHIYYDCYDGNGQKLMFVEDAKAYGYEKCFYCYDNYPNMNYLPQYDELIRLYKPEYGWEHNY